MIRKFPCGSKSDWQEQAEQIVSGNVQLSSSELPTLLEWLQDMNWPGAFLIAKYLPSFGHQLQEPVRLVLMSGDLIWIRWVLSALADSFDGFFWKPLQPYLEPIAFGRDEEGAHIEAMYILTRCRLVSPAKIQAEMNDVKTLQGMDAEDYLRLVELLKKEG